MSEIDHALILCILCQVRLFKGGMNIHGLSCSFNLINEKKEDKYIIWEFVYELWINYGFYKENSKFSELDSSIEFNVSLGSNSIFNGLVNEIWEVERISLEKPYWSDQIIAVYAILNQDISFLASKLYYLLNSECVKCICQTNLVYSLLSWTKLYISKP